MSVSLFCDFHMHSCLSPCGNDDMTPNNIANMAYIKGLDAIAVSDHNSAKNLPAVKTICDSLGILLIPAIEVESREEVHVVCYFPTVEAALTYSDMLSTKLQDIPWSTKIFGEQIIMDAEDNIIGHEEKYLAQATTLDIEEIFASCRECGGEPVPAHINRESNSVLFMLGFIPPALSVHSVELSRLAPPPKNFDHGAYNILHSSDAHCLENIFERDNEIRLKEKSISAFLAFLRS